MNLDKNIIGEKEKKKKELNDIEKKQELKKQLEFSKTKEKIILEIEIEEEIFHLKELIEMGVITKETANKVIEGKDISEEEIKEIFKKIDEIEDVKDVEKYLPKNLRILKDDYLRATYDDVFRVQILTKIESSLALLGNQIVPDSIIGLNILSGFLSVLDKNLIKIQENTIDVKNSLKEIDNKKGLYKDSRTNWQKFLDFIKEIIK